jgi:3-hydroxymyristoyl/3-hydroxydecanoyl-(acyl carrier protein) dehydratase
MVDDGPTPQGAGDFLISAAHPALPGHFPGEPVVPGVVVLDCVLALIGAGCETPRSLAWVKFARPLLPEQRADVRWSASGSGVRFTVSHEGIELVRGQLSGPAA